MQSSSDGNTAAQLAALIRRAAAAQEAADSAQQQLSQATQAHAQQMAGAQAAAESIQQELSHASQSSTQLQQELAAARQSHADQAVVLQQQHADQVAELQQQHAEQLAAVKTGFSGTLAVLQVELSEAKSSLTSTREQHAKSLTELQNCFDNQLAVADSKHAVMLAASHAELAAVRQHNIQQRLNMDQDFGVKLAQNQSLHSPDALQADSRQSAAVARADSQLESAVAKHSSNEAPFQHSAASSSVAKLMTLEQHSSQAAANSEARVVTVGESACTALRQRLTALEKQLALAQAEILVHASSSVGRFQLVCRLMAEAKGSKHRWAATDHAKQMQQLLQSVAGAVRKQRQADHTRVVADDSQGFQQHAVTRASRAKEEHGPAHGYPSDEDDLDDWTQEGYDDDSEADCAKEKDSTDTAGNNQSTWAISAGVTNHSSSHNSHSFSRYDHAQRVTNVSSSDRAETAGTAAPEHASQGSCAEVRISSSAQSSSRSFPAANVTVSVDPDHVFNSHPPEQLLGAQAVPAANSGISSASDNAGWAKGDHSCEASSAGVVKIDSSSVTEMHPSEENDLDDWTCDESDACANGGRSCVLTSSTVAETKSSSVFNGYPSDEDDLDDWTQEDVNDGTLIE